MCFADVSRFSIHPNVANRELTFERVTVGVAQRPRLRRSPVIEATEVDVVVERTHPGRSRKVYHCGQAEL